MRMILSLLYLLSFSVSYMAIPTLGNIVNSYFSILILWYFTLVGLRAIFKGCRECSFLSFAVLYLVVSIYYISYQFSWVQHWVKNSVTENQSCDFPPRFCFIFNRIVLIFISLAFLHNVLQSFYTLVFFSFFETSSKTLKCRRSSLLKTFDKRVT